ncbi:hypothetical protein H9Y04_07835 [Streptomyces sp. TRM66268-LWL]|uniref:Integral membrane protein n=1 Tax=Streptomyces polyasparticus TaxID=2767826 RepID=A0ABR7SCL6_9ACTN|nr:hypothetical protein [Streptomyces polyasparticus]MBC9712480.1 hypothetical protein [Streptomyces polyasparticus]
MRSATTWRVLKRLTVHEFKAFHSLGLWIARRRHQVGPGAHGAGYTQAQTALIFGFLFVAVVETVVLLFLIPWPLVHAIVTFIDVYGVIQILGLHAACVTRPHVAQPDGSLRIRYGALFDVTAPAALIRSVRVERRYPQGKHFQLSEDGVLDVVIGGQTTVTVELTEPVSFVRPLGSRGEARVFRFNADDPAALVAAHKQALKQARTAPSPSPDPLA